MSFTRAIKRKARAAAPPLLFLLLLGYFGWNAMNGDRGLKATALRMNDLRLAQAELAQAEAERAAWAHRIAGLKPGHLDPDTLDERARAMLNMADPSEIVVPYPKDKRLF